MRLWRHGGRRTATATIPLGARDDPTDLNELDELDELDGPGGLDGSGGAPGGRGTGDPVLLTLTTREQVEKAQVEKAEVEKAAAAGAPKMVRVRPGRGAFGGAAASSGGGGCGGGCSH